MMLEWQSQMTKAWFDIAQTSARAMADNYQSAGRSTSQIFGGGYAFFAPPAPAFSFPWMPALSAPQTPALWPFNPTAWAAPRTIGFNPFGAYSAFNPWAGPFQGAPWSFSAPATPAEVVSPIIETIAASYRTAGGHATAMIMAPFQPQPQPKPVRQRNWWEWPTMGSNSHFH
jgi:hypothetical protein